MLTTVHSPIDDRIFYKEALSIRRAGYKVSVVAPSDRDEKLDDVDLIALPRPKTRRERILLGRIAFRVACALQCDAYHIHDPELLPVASRLNRRQGVAVLYDIHEDLPRSLLSKPWIPRPFRGIAMPAARVAERHYAARMSALIATTRLIAENFDDLGVPITLVRNFPSRTIFRNLEPAARQTQRRQNRVVFTGGMSEIRGIMQLIRGFKLVLQTHPDAELILMGTFEGQDFEQKIRQLIAGESLGAAVHIHDPIPHTAVPDFLETTGIGVVPYLPEPNHLVTLPIKLFEYMAAGAAVLTSDFPLYREVVASSRCGRLVDPTNPNDIALKLVDMLEDPDALLEMGSRGRSAIKSKYNWENESRSLVGTYETLLGPP